MFRFQAVRELTGLVEGANALLSGSKGLETKYLSLPSYASQRLSLALEADPNAVRSVTESSLANAMPMDAARQARSGFLIHVQSHLLICHMPQSMATATFG
jgi:hypothetical protein